MSSDSRQVTGSYPCYSLAPLYWFTSPIHTVSYGMTGGPAFCLGHGSTFLHFEADSAVRCLQCFLHVTEPLISEHLSPRPPQISRAPTEGPSRPTSRSKFILKMRLLITAKKKSTGEILLHMHDTDKHPTHQGFASPTRLLSYR